MALYLHIGAILDGRRESNNMVDWMIHHCRVSFEHRLDLLEDC